MFCQYLYVQDPDEEKENECSNTKKVESERDEFKWNLCTNSSPHGLEGLVLVQVMAGNALDEIIRLFHQVRNVWNIPQECDCEEAKKYRKDQVSTFNLYLYLFLFVSSIVMHYTRCTDRFSI